MKAPWWAVACGIAAALVAGAAGGIALYPRFLAKEEPKKEPGEQAEHVKISPQARANLGLKVEQVFPVKEYWRTLKIPGQIVEREGNCDRLIAARLSGVVKDIAAVRGDLVRPGARLFTLEVVSEPVQTAQAAYHKNQLELKIVAEEQKRLKESFAAGDLPMARKIALDNQWNKLTREKTALEHELKIRGLTDGEIAGLAQGKFVQEITIIVPPHPEEHSAAGASPKAPHPHSRDFAYEVEDLKIKLGEQVQAGQALCLLAHHYRLQIEGKVFESERGLVQQAAEKGLAVRAEFPPQSGQSWPSDVADLKISFLENKIDPHQTLSFYVPLANDFKEYERLGKTYRLWRFRPGQRAQLHVPVQRFADVFVVPAAAVVREGPETYVFRENGDYMQRLSVHVVHADRQIAILANDGSLLPGYGIALSGAAQLNWALKSQSGGEESGHHHHHH